MKYLIRQSIFLFLVVLTGCVTSNVSPQSELYHKTGYDFSPYTAKGFYFTPEQYLGEYEPVGMISIKYIPEFIRQGRNQTTTSTGASRITPSEEEREREEFERTAYTEYLDPNDPSIVWKVKNPSPEKLINQAYELAVSMGANAITRFSITEVPHYNGNLQVKTIQLNGFALKRMD